MFKSNKLLIGRFYKWKKYLIFTYVTNVADVSCFLADFCIQLINKTIKQ